MSTIEEIAREAGVSIITVSRVLRYGSSYKRPTFARRAAKIQAIAERLNYRPNASARAIRTGRFNCLALLLGDEFYLPAELMGGLYRATLKYNIHLAIASLHHKSLLNHGEAPKVLRELMADGVLINSNVAASDSEHYAALDHFHVPFMTMNFKREYEAVYPDDFAGAKWLTEQLIARGHRDIAYVITMSKGLEHYSVKDREAGYHAAMLAAGLTPRVHSATTLPAGTSRQEFLRAVLAPRDRPTAVVTYSASTAGPVYATALRLGLDVPRDLSVVTFDNRLYEYADRPLSTILIPWEQVAFDSIEMMLAKVADREGMLPARAVSYKQELPGETCAPPPPRRKTMR